MFSSYFEPRAALLLGSLIALFIILIGDLNVIAPIISNFFLCSYALINYACFDNSFAHSPGFRPSFKFYNMWVSLAGAFMCVFVMFVISWSTALLTFFFFTLIFAYLAHRKPDVNWGSSTQAHCYKNALQYVTKLERIDEHVKNYRPQILVLSGNPAARAGLVDFAYSITKGNSLLLTGYVVPYMPSHSVFAMIHKLSVQLRQWFKLQHIKAFPLIVTNVSLRAGVQMLFQLAGLGKLRPNIVTMGFKTTWMRCCSRSAGANDGDNHSMAELLDYFGIVQDAFDHNMSVAILRNGNCGFDVSAYLMPPRQQMPSGADDVATSSGLFSKYPAAPMHVSGGDGGGDDSRSIGSMIVPHQQQQQQEEVTTMRSVPGQSSTGQKARQLFLRAFGSGRSTLGSLDDFLPTYSTVSSTTTAFDPNSTISSRCSTMLTGVSIGGGGDFETVSNTIVSRESNATPHGRENPATSNVDGISDAANTERVRRGTAADLHKIAISSSANLPADISRFHIRVKHAIIDVWWLYDDGGLTLLIPYLLTQSKSYLENAKLRVFTFAEKGKQPDQEQKSMVALLTKFRISAMQVNVIPDSMRKPSAESLSRFAELVRPFMVKTSGNDSSENASYTGFIFESELRAQQEKSWRHLRLSELLRKHSSRTDLIVVTLPVPRRGRVSAALYMAWLETISRDLPPTLMVRGNQQSVLTFYS